MRIVLNKYEMLMASQVGLQRQVDAKIGGAMDGHGLVGPGWNENMEGSAAELAVAKALDIHWGGGMDGFKTPDLGKNLQIRSTISHNYSLIVRPVDPDEDFYILVTGTAPEYWVRGYIVGTAAKNDRWTRDPNERPDAYFVPSEALLPIEDLKEAIKNAK